MVAPTWVFFHNFENGLLTLQRQNYMPVWPKIAIFDIILYFQGFFNKIGTQFYIFLHSISILA